MNCEGCTRRHSSSTKGYCEEFQEQPHQLDSCAMHSKHDEARAAMHAKASGQVTQIPTNDKGHYLWLDKAMLDDHMPPVSK